MRAESSTLDHPCAEVIERADREKAGGLELRAEPSRWFVLYVRSRQEKVLSEDLIAMGVAHYLPLVRRQKYYGKRKITVELPLFPGYLFLQGSLDDLYMADRTRRVARIIPVANPARLERELRNIRLALGQRAELSPYPFLVAGTRVVVRSGPLCGLEGVIEHRGKGERLILQVEMLGQATSVEIDGALLDRLD